MNVSRIVGEIDFELIFFLVDFDFILKNLNIKMMRNQNEMKHLDKISLIQKVTVVQSEERPLKFKRF